MTPAPEDLHARIARPEVRAACDALLGGFEGFGEYSASFNVKGSKKSVHFKSGGKAHYAFIANADWLLWYFRRPGLTDGLFTFQEVLRRFPSSDYSKRSNPDRREVVLRIETPEAARDLLDFVTAKRST